VSEELNQPPETPEQAAPPAAEQTDAAHPPEQAAPEPPKELEGRPLLQVPGPEPSDDGSVGAPVAQDAPSVAQSEKTAEPPAEETGTAEPVEEPGPEPEPEPAATEVSVAPPEVQAAGNPEEPAESAGEEPEPAAGGETREEPAEEEEPKSENMDWYILKVQSNREDSIREALLRRVKIAGLDPFFGDVIVPTETVTEFKGGKKRVSKRKLYPGYLVAHMEINDDTWFLVRETPGIGDFTGAAGRPSPMLPHEVERIVARTHEEKGEKEPKVKIGFRPGDQVKINEGTFENFEGEVGSIDETNGRVTVMINIFNRTTPVELEYWQIESV
jgi:transcription termination/antitermination protein NusG